MTLALSYLSVNIGLQITMIALDANYPFALSRPRNSVLAFKNIQVFNLNFMTFYYTATLKCVLDSKFSVNTSHFFKTVG